jgi:hypothetical protein
MAKVAAVVHPRIFVIRLLSCMISRSLVIRIMMKSKDGTEKPKTIPDPDRRLYWIEAEKIEKRGEHVCPEGGGLPLR